MLSVNRSTGATWGQGPEVNPTQSTPAAASASAASAPSTTEDEAMAGLCSHASRVGS